MDISPLAQPGHQLIQAYAKGRFRVSGQIFETPVLVFSDTTVAWSIPAGGDIASLKPEDFEPLYNNGRQIDVVLLGMGNTMTFIPPSLKDALRGKGLVIEAMDTGAACRTYNVLVAEGRRVAAALMLSS